MGNLRSYKCIIYSIALVLVMGNAWMFHSSKSNATEITSIPNLLITEVVPDTDNYAGYDAFEYVEIYNNSSQEINLKGYHLQSGGWDAKIETSIKIAPWDTVLFWTRRQEIQPITLEAFNHNYFASYESKYVDESKLKTLDNIGGLVNSKTQTVSVFDSNGNEVVRASYTGDVVYTNKSITFTYPQDDSIVMQTLSGNVKPTPGWIDPNQAPLRPKQDEVAPQIPANIKADAGNGEVSIAWDPNPETDLYRYNVYKNGTLEYSVSPEKYNFTIYALTGNRDVTLQVTAVDTSGNESEKSSPITVTPAHQIITQEERSSNDRDPKYQGLWNISKDGPVIPGLVQDLVPQGLG
ncbi:lamin tail domain-containing protein [Heyndrickxia camelliae]|uniref:LTD domain-containing protein n=1 Tax=Heyndrickxia camelliae TaxID=1707093 RepID=A0A2N3LP69_9BACI|nr:lamin tail domain-containing protein [Heyndrickxia camelliae]PKR86410.1 hypothetical protein CWO92_04755 [Heyndrickxia camelliae]